MTSLRARAKAICTALPGAEASDPWGGGHEAWKIGGKMFACFGAVIPGVSVKCADIDTAQMLIEAGIGTRAPYFHRSWIQLPDDVADAELAARLTAAYDLIRAGLPKRVQATLPPRPEEE